MDIFVTKLTIDLAIPFVYREQDGAIVSNIEHVIKREKFPKICLTIQNINSGFL